MALMNCPECGKEISDTAKKCPNCGFKLSKGINKMLLVILIVAGCLLILAVVLVISILRANNKKVRTGYKEGAVNTEEQVQTDGKQGGSSVELSPNLGVTFTATRSNENLDGVYNLVLSQELPLVITDYNFGEATSRVTITKIDYYTALQNETAVLRSGAQPMYALYYTLEYDFENLSHDKYGSSFYINIVYYDQNGNIKYSHMLEVDENHSGRLIENEYDAWLPLDTYKIEFSDYQ